MEGEELIPRSRNLEVSLVRIGFEGGATVNKQDRRRSCYPDVPGKSKGPGKCHLPVDML